MKLKMEYGKTLTLCAWCATAGATTEGRRAAACRKYLRNALPPLREIKLYPHSQNTRHANKSRNIYRPQTVSFND